MSNAATQKIALAKSTGWSVSPKKWTTESENRTIYTYRLVLPNGDILEQLKLENFYSEDEVWELLPDDPNEWAAFELEMQGDLNFYKQQLKDIRDEYRRQLDEAREK